MPFPVLRVLHDEPFRGLRERDDVVALSEKMHPFAVEDLQHLVIGRHVVGFQEGLARDRHQLPIEDSLVRSQLAPPWPSSRWYALSTRSRIALN